MVKQYMQIDAVAFHFRSQSHRSRVWSATTWQNPAIAHQLVAERCLSVTGRNQLQTGC